MYNPLSARATWHLLPSYFLHPSGYSPGTLLRYCLWTVSDWVTNLTRFSSSGSVGLVGLGWPVPRGSSGRGWTQALESHLPPGGALALSRLCFIFSGQDPTVSSTLDPAEEGWHSGGAEGWSGRGMNTSPVWLRVQASPLLVELWGTHQLSLQSISKRKH